MLAIVFVLEVGVDFVLVVHEVDFWVHEQSLVFIEKTAKLKFLGGVLRRFQYLLYLLFTDHSIHHKEAVIVDEFNVNVLVAANIVVNDFFECFKKVLQAAEDVVDFTGFNIMRMCNLIPRHFEVSKLLFEFQVVLVPRVDIEIVLEALLIDQFHKHRTHEVQVCVLP